MSKQISAVGKSGHLERNLSHPDSGYKWYLTDWQMDTASLYCLCGHRNICLEMTVRPPVSTASVRSPRRFGSRTDTNKGYLCTFLPNHRTTNRTTTCTIPQTGDF
ncbi:hypothetical protein Bbelb_120960 [Branchiostoma belcheri]|nr:hypothetical protein Bbelb_120960 [Branchiostoma belcheri]